MILAQTIAEIVKLSLEITLEVIKDTPADVRRRNAEEFWKQHQKNLEFWQGLMPKDTAKGQQD